LAGSSCDITLFVWELWYCTMTHNSTQQRCRIVTLLMLKYCKYLVETVLINY
jgi:hypothetical protein